MPWRFLSFHLYYIKYTVVARAIDRRHKYLFNPLHVPFPLHLYKKSIYFQRNHVSMFVARATMTKISGIISLHIDWLKYPMKHADWISLCRFLAWLWSKASYMLCSEKDVQIKSAENCFWMWHLVHISESETKLYEDHLSRGKNS